MAKELSSKEIGDAPAELKEMLLRQTREVQAYVRGDIEGEKFERIVLAIDGCCVALKGMEPNDRRMVVKVLIETIEVLEKIGEWDMQ